MGPTNGAAAEHGAQDGPLARPLGLGRWLPRDGRRRDTLNRLSLEEALEEFPFLQDVEDASKVLSPAPLKGAMRSTPSPIGNVRLEVWVADWTREFTAQEVMNRDDESLGGGWERWVLYVLHRSTKISEVELRAGTEIERIAPNMVTCRESTVI